MPYTVKCETDNVSFSQINSEMLELRAVLNVRAEVMKHTERRLVDNVEEVEE